MSRECYSWHLPLRWGLGHKDASPGLQSQLMPALATCKHTHTHAQTHSLWHRNEGWVGKMWVASFSGRIALVEESIRAFLYDESIRASLSIQKPKQQQRRRRVAGPSGDVHNSALSLPNTFSHVSNLPSLPRSCVAERFLAGSTAWPTSVPVCHSSRAACPKSGWRRLPCSPASARSCTEPGSWRRRRTPPPRPPWRPCRRARPPPPPALPLCPVTLATSRAGRRCGLGWQTLNWLQRWTEDFLSDCIHPSGCRSGSQQGKGLVWLVVVVFWWKGKKSWCWRRASSDHLIDPNLPLPAKKQKCFMNFLFWIYQLFRASL